jgi:hypothetical protein
MGEKVKLSDDIGGRKGDKSFYDALHTVTLPVADSEERRSSPAQGNNLREKAAKRVAAYYPQSYLRLPL